MSFNKTGDSQPLDVVYTCCICEMAASQTIDGKNYCATHAPKQEEPKVLDTLDTNEKQ